jgi:hypothetical protein
METRGQDDLDERKGRCGGSAHEGLLHSKVGEGHER